MLTSDTVNLVYLRHEAMPKNGRPKHCHSFTAIIVANLQALFAVRPYNNDKI